MTAIKNCWNWCRQPVSGLSHLMGAILALVGLIWMVSESLQEGSVSKLIPSVVFGVSMVMLFLASALYHLLPVSEARLKFLRKIDHSSIYVFIAGSYTPICLLLLKDGKGPWIFGAVWGLAFLGVAFKFWRAKGEGSRWMRSGLYLAMGWLSVLIMPDLWRALPPGGIAWLIAGGLVYSLGAVVYALRWPDPFPEVFGFHEVWHLFVLGGSFCHFWMVKNYLLVM